MCAASSVTAERATHSYNDRVHEPVTALLREYQDYVLAYRLRHALGGRVAPPHALLAVSTYAAKRLERQALARALVRKDRPRGTFRDLDRLTDELAFGFWYNPTQVADFLTAAVREGGHAALGSPLAFAALFTTAEHERLAGQAERVCVHYLTCLSLAAPGIDPVSLDRIYSLIEAYEVPIFIDELHDGERSSSP